MEEKLDEWHENYPDFQVLPQYIAGFADGDGSICMTKISGGYQLLGHFSQSYPLFCFILQKSIGGSIYNSNREKQKKRMEYTLRLCGKDNLPFFKIMKEHAIIKMKQAELGEYFLNNYHRKINGNEEQVEQIYNKITDLNKSCPIPEERFNKLNWIYIAGLFDAEGCIICSVSTKKRYNLYLTQKNHMDLLEQIKNYIGYGAVKKDDYRIVISTIPNVIHFLNQTIQYLIVKRKQAEAMLKYLNKRHNMPHNHPDYSVITEEDMELINIISNEKVENIEVSEVVSLYKMSNNTNSKNKTKLYKSYFVPKPLNTNADRSTKNKVSKRATNFDESTALIKMAELNQRFDEILNDWNRNNETQVNDRQLLNLWNGKTELLPFEFKEDSPWTYQEYCDFMVDLPNKRFNVERNLS